MGGKSEGAAVSRQVVEKYLYDEANLLDCWRLDDWLKGLAPEMRYVVPTCDHHEVQEDGHRLFLLADSFQMLEGRLLRLMSNRAQAERPLSRTRRMISNVRIIRDEGGEIDIEANFIIYKSRKDHIFPFIGRYEITLVRDGAGFKQSKRHAILDHYDLSKSGGIVSIIL